MKRVCLRGVRMQQLRRGDPGSGQGPRTAFKVETGRGKGGHAMIWVGDRFTTLPSRDIDPKTARKIRKALGLG